MSMHWATPYIGRSYESVGRCFGFVQLVCREHLNVDMPGAAEAIRQRGWRKAATGPMPDDIVVMKGPSGRHVGIAVEADGQTGLLHARKCGVCFEDFRDLCEFRDFEYYRRTECFT